MPVFDTVFPNSGECTDAVAPGPVDVAFMPVDPARSARVAFGPAYDDIESTYLVSAASGIATLADVDRPGLRIVGIADTTTIRASARSLHHHRPVPIRGVEEAVAMLRDGRADALALSRDSLAQVAPTIPGSRIVDGGFQRTRVAIAVPPGNPAALAAASAFLDRAKRDGTVRRALDDLRPRSRARGTLRRILKTGRASSRSGRPWRSGSRRACRGRGRRPWSASI